MKLKSLLALTILVAASSVPNHAITTSGLITGNETWSGTVFLTGDVTVTSTGSLTILPGTRIECDAGADDQIGGTDSSRIEIIVDQGKLNAVGTDVSPIVFTSSPVPPKAAAPADWYGLIINSTNATVQYCTFEYGDNGLNVRGGNPLISHCIFQRNSERGFILSLASTPSILEGSISDCTSQNNGNGVYIASGRKLTLTGCTIDRNGSKGSGGVGIYGEGATSVVIGSEVSSNYTYGVLLWGNSDFGGSKFVASNTKIQDNGASGISVDGFPWEGSVILSNSTVIARNAGSGIGPDPRFNSGVPGTYSVVIQDSAITDNGGLGVNYIGSAAVVRSTVARNGDVGFGDPFGGYWQQPQNQLSMTLFLSASTLADNGGIGADVGSVSAYDSTITGNQGAGLAFRIWSTNAINRNVISGNKIGLLPMLSETKIEGIADNTISGNRDYEIKNGTSSAIITDGNYWGEPTTTELKTGVRNLSKIYDSRDDANVGQIAIRTWLDAPIDPNAAPTLEMTVPGALTVVGNTGRIYRIQYVNSILTNGALDWTTISDFTLTAPSGVFTDTTSGGQAMRFYRAVLLP